MRRHALAGLLYALPADRRLVDVRALAPLDPDQVAGLDGTVFVSDVPQGQPADLQR